MKKNILLPAKVTIVKRHDTKKGKFLSKLSCSKNQSFLNINVMVEDIKNIQNKFDIYKNYNFFTTNKFEFNIIAGLAFCIFGNEPTISNPSFILLATK